jgi:hypothetical protein
MLLLGARQETGRIDQGHQRNVEGVAEADKTRALIRGVDIQHTGQVIGLVGDNAHRVAIQAAKANHQVAGVFRLYFQELAIIHQRFDHFAHIIRALRVVRTILASSGTSRRGIIDCREKGGGSQVVGRQVGQQ